MAFIEPWFGIGHNLSLICQMTSEDIKHQLIITSSGWPWLAYCEWKSGRYTGQTVFSCRKTWLKSRWSNPKRKITIKNTQSLRILMASGLRLTYMSKLDMHSVTLKVRDIQVWQPSMAPAFGIFGWQKYTQAIMISSEK